MGDGTCHIQNINAQSVRQEAPLQRGVKVRIVKSGAPAPCVVRHGLHLPFEALPRLLGQHEEQRGKTGFFIGGPSFFLQYSRPAAKYLAI